MVLTYHRAVRVVALAVIAASLVACAGEPARPPRDAANACLAAIEAAGTTPAAVREALACRGLYRDRGCGAAWVALAVEGDPADFQQGLQIVEETCRRACLRQSRGSPPRGCLDAEDRYGLGDSGLRRRLVPVMAIDQALHELAGLPTDLAARLSTRAALFAVLPGATLDEPTLPTDAAVAPGTVVIRLLATGSTLVDGNVVGDDQLTALLQARDDAGDAVAVVEADPAVPYQRVVDVLDELRAAGVTDIRFHSAPP